MTDRKARIHGSVLLACAALAWSFGGLWIKEVHLLHPIAVAGARSAVAALVIWVYMRLSGMGSPDGYRRHFIGAVAYAGTVIFFVAATRNTTAANAILLQYTAPIWVALFSRRFLGESVSRLDWATILAVLGGMTVFFIDDVMSSRGGLVGNLLAVVSGVFFAACAIALRKQRASSPIITVLLGNILAAAIGLPFFFISVSPTGRDLYYILLLGVLQLGLGYVLFVQGVRRVTALESILIPMIEPVLNPVWVFAFIGEQPSTLAILGGAIVVAAVTAQGIIKIRRR